MIYLDNNASTRVFDVVVAAMQPFLTREYANPGSGWGHRRGLDRLLADAVAGMGAPLGAANPENWVVTSGATEANNLALLGAARAHPRRRHVIVSAVEHPSVSQPAEHLRQEGYRVTVLPVDRCGLVSPEQVEAVLAPDTLLVSVILVHNETGVVQPVAEIAGRVKARAPEVLVHTDATQAIGKRPVGLSTRLADVDLLSFSAHKFHGPKAVGALFVREPRRLAPLLFGGGQQAGLRPGTESPALVVGLATAVREVNRRRSEYAAIGRMRDALERHVAERLPGSFAVGASSPRVATTSFLCLPGRDGAEVAERLAAQEIAVATGSACSHGHRAPSTLALAMGLTPEQALGCIRVSLSLDTTPEELERFADALGPIGAPVNAAPVALR